MIKITKFTVSLIFFLALLFPNLTKAHQPVIEPVRVISDNRSIYAQAFKLEDPSEASLAVYGAISAPREFDIYAFASHATQTIPVELLVPAWPHNKDFHPSLVIFSKTSPKTTETFPVDLPEGYGAITLNWNEPSEKFYEPFSQERLIKGIKFDLAVEEGKNYFLAVRNLDNQKGEYVVGLGSVENFKSQSKFDLINSILTIKLNLFNQVAIPWLDILGLCLILAGFIVGLGQDTKSYKGIKKYQFWLGVLLIVCGSTLTFRETWLSGVILFEAILFVVIIVNKLVFDFYSLPKESFRLSLINKIISVLCWWVALLLLVWYILAQR